MLKIIALSLFSTAIIFAPTFAQTNDAQLLLDGLRAPQGVFIDSEGSVYVIDSGEGGEESLDILDSNYSLLLDVPFGMTSHILKLNENGETEDIATFPSLLLKGNAIGATRITELNGFLYATVGAWHITWGIVPIEYFASVVKIADGEISPATNLWAYDQTDNPNGEYLDEFESRPYGIAAGEDGLLFVVDAAADAIFSIDTTTEEVSTVFRFTTAGDIHYPTGIVVTEEGTIFFATFSVPPYRPYGANIMRITSDGVISEFTPALPSLIDLQMGPDGYLYALSYGIVKKGKHQPNTGMIWRIPENGIGESGVGVKFVVDDLLFPTGFAFDADGNAYVTVGGAATGTTGKLLYYEDLVNMEGKVFDWE